MTRRCVECGASLIGESDVCHRCLLAVGLAEEQPQAGADACPACGKRLTDDGTCPNCTATASLSFDDDVQVPGYLILGLLGEGGMGRVYLAEDVKLRRRVAVKVISERLSGRPEAIDRFLLEARSMAAVEHPSIVRVLSFGELAGRSYMVMEYVEGEGLNRRIARDGALPVHTALRFLRQSVEALQAAWKLGIVHRDIKPSNVLISEGDRLRVTDFGLAKALNRPEDLRLTVSGHVVGTPLYMSPEQAVGDELDFRTDIYSLGIMFFEMLAGRPPYRSNVAAKVIEQHRHATFPSLRELRPEVPESVEQLCEWMTRKDPPNRPASHDELLSTIDLVAEGGCTAESLPGIPWAEPPSSSDAMTPVTPITPIFVARDREMKSLSGFLERALGGAGQVAFVTGEAGSGKTTLALEFVRQSSTKWDELVVVQGNCDARTGSGDPYLPFRQILGQLTGEVESRLAAKALSRAEARRLWALFPQVAETIAEAGPNLVETFLPGEPLLARAKERAPGVAGWRVRIAELVKRNAARPLDQRPQQSDLLDEYAQVLIRISRTRPILIILEDLHWIDLGSAALLHHLGLSMQAACILVIGTYRPDEIEIVSGDGRHPLQPVCHDLKRRFGDTEVPVGREGGREFVDAYIDARPNRLDEAFRKTLHERTLGHSLFTVELLRDLQERDMLIKDDDGFWCAAASLDWSLLPARIEGVIGERIGRLPEECRQILDLAGVEGEEFTAEAIAEALDRPPRDIVRILGSELDRRHRLVQAREVQRVGGRRLSRYAFRHILFQKYLYGELDDAERSYMHEQIGEILERLHGDGRGEIADVLAAHFESAGLADRAIGYLVQASHRASRMAANTETVEHAQHALRLLRELPESAERMATQIDLHFALVSPLSALGNSLSDPDLMQAMVRTQELCDAVGDTRRSFLATHNLMSGYGAATQWPEAEKLGRRLFELADQTGDPLFSGMAHWNQGFILYYQGRYAEAIPHLEVLPPIYDIGVHGELGPQFGFDPAVCCWLYWANSQWALGFPDRAAYGIRKLVGLIERLEHLQSRLMACYTVTVRSIFSGDTKTMRSGLASYARILPEKGFPSWAAGLDQVTGWLQAEEGDVDGGIERMRRGLEGWRMTLSQGLAALLLGERLLAGGRFEEGLAIVEESVDRHRTSNDRAWLPDLHRLRGDLLVALGRPDEEAEESYHQAETKAREQQARSWLLRTVMGQARLMDRQGRRAEARAKLGELYATFDEGLETRDLRAARELLRSLGT